MKVLIIFPHQNALSPNIGATARTLLYTKSFIKNNYEVSILHSMKAKGLEDKQLVNKCKIYYHKELKIYALKEKFFNDLNPFLVYKLYKIIKAEKFDIIHFEFPFGFILLKLLVGNKSKLIYDSHGIESEFVKISYFEKGFPRLLYGFVRSFTKRYEKITCKIADSIISVSNIDKQFYMKEFKIEKDKIEVILQPSILKNEDYLSINPELKKNLREQLNLPLNDTLIVFHGGVPHPPNEEAFKLIENYIAPKFNALDITFILAGHNLKKYRKKNIISMGFVENLDDLLNATDFAIVPIISGEGLKIKCSDYISVALPFISTKKGIQGIYFLENGKDILIYDTVNSEYLDGIKTLYENKELRKKFHHNLTIKSCMISQENSENLLMNLHQKLIGITKKQK